MTSAAHRVDDVAFIERRRFVSTFGWPRLLRHRRSTPSLHYWNDSSANGRRVTDSSYAPSASLPTNDVSHARLPALPLPAVRISLTSSTLAAIFVTRSRHSLINAQSCLLVKSRPTTSMERLRREAPSNQLTGDNERRTKSDAAKR